MVTENQLKIELQKPAKYQNFAYEDEKMTGTQMFTLARNHMTVVFHPSYSTDQAVYVSFLHQSLN
jgi:hypothetical protein